MTNRNFISMYQQPYKGQPNSEYHEKDLWYIRQRTTTYSLQTPGQTSSRIWKCYLASAVYSRYENVEGVQCRATKVIPELRDKPYQERLQNLYSMEYRKKGRHDSGIYNLENNRQNRS